MALPALVALAGVAAGCGAGSDGEKGTEPGASTDAEPAHRSLGADAEPLRSAFETDRGKVRAIFLVSPT